MKRIEIGGEKNCIAHYAILLPTGGVLVRSGAQLGLASIITKKAAKAAGIKYLIPAKWDNSNLYIYPNKEVRDQKGHYLGTYLGYEQDNFSGEIIYSTEFGGAYHDFFLKKEENIYRVGYNGSMTRVSGEYMILCRLHWTSEWAIAGESYPEEDKIMSRIKEIARLHPMTLKAALEFQRYSKYKENDKDEEVLSE